MILFELLLVFSKIGFTSFGGMSMIPLIYDEMLSRSWMTQSEVLDIVAIAEITPGPLGLNCATFAGMNVYGIPGALAANIGVMLPSFTLCAIAAMCLEKFSNSKALKEVLTGIRPACTGLILSVLLLLAYENVLPNGSFYYQSMLIIAISAFCIWKWKLSVTKTLALAALLGMILC